MDLGRWWWACDEVFGQEGVAAEWLRALGGDESAWQWTLRHGLVRATGELAMAYPKLDVEPESFEPYDVVCHNEEADDYVGVCPDDTGNIPLTRAQLAVYALDRSRLCAELAAALSLTPDQAEVAGLRHVWRVGAYEAFEAAEAWAYLSLPMSDADLTDAAVRLVGLHEQPFLILTPTKRWWRAWPDALHRRGRVAALADVVPAPAAHPSTAGAAGAGILHCATSVPALLGHLLPRAKASARLETVATFRKEGSGWIMAFEGDPVPMSHMVGYSYIALLLARPEEAVPAARLLAWESGRPELSRRGKDRGQPMIDGPGWAKVRDAFGDLRKEVAAARASQDPARQEAVRVKLERLADAKAKAQGKGGRGRRVGSDADNARRSVGNALDRAMEKLQHGLPALHRHLDTSIERGSLLCYRPKPPVPWQL